MTVYTMDELAAASGLSTERLQKIDEEHGELESLAEAVLLEDGDSSGSTNSSGGRTGSGSDVSLSANTRTFAEAQGLPTNWAALEGIDLPPRLAEMQLSNDVLAKAINYAQGYDAGHPERVSTLTLNRIRDKGGQPVSTGASLDDIDATNAGERTSYQRNTGGPSAGAVKTMIDRHRPAGDVPARNTTADDTALSMGFSLDDMGEGE